MSKRISLLLVTFVAACSGRLSMSNLVGGSSTTASNGPDGSSATTSSSRNSGGEESYSLAEPPKYKDDPNLLTMPKFFQAVHMYGANRRGAWKTFWFADLLGDQLGEHARMVLVDWCLKERNDLAYMACTGDAHRLDRARLIAELDVPAARKFRTSALEHFDAITKAVAARDAQIAQRVKDDPALAQVYQVIPRAVWKQWDSFTAAHRPLLATARRLEIASQKRHAFDETKGPSRKAYAGCLEELAPQFAKVVRATRLEKSDSFVEPFQIATTPVGYITTLAMYYCALGNDLAISGALGSELTEGAMLRGPRMATIEAVLAKSQSLKFDDKSYEISPWRDANYINEDQQLIGDNGGGYGLIKKVTRDGDKLHITFASEPFSYEECVRSVPSNTWRYDRSTGILAPIQNCVQWVTKKDSQETPPIDLPASQGAGIQAGRLLEWGTTRKVHAVRAVWDSGNKKRAFAIYGVAR